MIVRFHSPWAARWTGPDAKGEGEDVLTQALFCEIDGERLVIPAGYKSDGASVPWFARMLIDPTHCRRAWVLHDWVWWSGHARHADILDAALKTDNCRPWARRLVVLAVRLFFRLRPDLRR